MRGFDIELLLRLLVLEIEMEMPKWVKISYVILSLIAMWAMSYHIDMLTEELYRCTQELVRCGC